MTQPLVVFGFGNSSGKMSFIVLKENYQKIRRFGQKISLKLPKLKSKPMLDPQIDFGHFAIMIENRTNETLLRSFLQNQDEEQLINLIQVQDFAQKQIQRIASELNAIDLLRQQLEVHKFVKQTNTTDDIAKQYHAQFNKDITKALKAYRKRKEIIKKFAQKNELSEQLAASILRYNGYNAALFE